MLQNEKKYIFLKIFFTSNSSSLIFKAVNNLLELCFGGNSFCDVKNERQLVHAAQHERGGLELADLRSCRLIKWRLDSEHSSQARV